MKNNFTGLVPTYIDRLINPRMLAPGYLELSK